MADVVLPHVRSKMMSGIRGKDTKPELLLRRALHRRGFRYRLHAKKLPGRPDMVFPKHKAVLFVHGCFWHCHLCHLFKWPSTREKFWQAKIGGNKNRDEITVSLLASAGWRIGTVWECALKGKHRLPVEEVITQCTEWIRSGQPLLDIAGHAA